MDNNNNNIAGNKTKITVIIIIAAVTVIGAFVGITAWVVSNVISNADLTSFSGTTLMFSGDSGDGYWNGSYAEMNGFRQRSVNLGEGTHVFVIEIASNSGKINFSVKGREKQYYSGSDIPTSSFEVTVEVPAGGGEKIELRIDAENHSGSYKVTWQ